MGGLRSAALCAGCVVSLALTGCRAPGTWAGPPDRGPPAPPAETPNDSAAATDGPVLPVFGLPRPAPATARPGVFGVVGLSAYPLAEQIAPNGVEFTPLFSLDLQTNLWLSPSQGVYAYADAAFWAQRAGPGVTNPSQGVFDFSKREFDLTGGLAWNYAGRWEGRAFAYSLNNLNRGTSVTTPAGYADGVGLENRYYLSDVYDALGTPDFDVARAPFVALGYYPTKKLVDNQGQPFKPGPFARAYLTVGLAGDRAYLYGEGTLTGTRAATPKLFQADLGAAVRPFAAAPGWEVRAGARGRYDLGSSDLEREVYVSIRFVY